MRTDLLKNKKGQTFGEIFIVIIILVIILGFLFLLLNCSSQTTTKNLLCQKNGYIEYEYKNDFNYCVKYNDNNNIIYEAVIFQCKNWECTNITFINKNINNTGVVDIK